MKKYILSGVGIALLIIVAIYYRYFGQPTEPKNQLVKNTNTESLPTPSTSLRTSPTPTTKPTAIPTLKPTAIPTRIPTSSPTSAPTSSPTSAPNPTSVPTYKDGSQQGNEIGVKDYGSLQVEAIFQAGKLTEVKILQSPNAKSESRSINDRALPILKSEAIQKQSAGVNTVSGATYSSEAFRQSLESAFNKAKS
jgi:uncharacterized protein with FMN-binding domain